MRFGLPAGQPSGASEPVTAPFYRAFEDRHRGARELIKERLRVYLPFVRPLARSQPGLAVLDLGCGRGEWLELLLENNITAQGVDLDDGMLAACRERGLSVAQGDALAHLAARADQSLLAVTGFHLAEHLPFAVLQTLFAQAHRVLAPGGLLILETPNPENLLVGAASFYIDPTHQRPLPSQLLTFLAEHQGFNPVKLLRLQEEARFAENQPVSLYDVLANVSPDYAIVAQVSSAADPAQALAPAFATECGVSLNALASRYDAHLQLRIEQLRVQLGTQEQATQAAHGKAEEALALAHQTGTRADQLASQLSAVYASHSWRISRPLRWLVRLFRGRSDRG